MKFKTMLSSNHDLKKNGYKIVRKLKKATKRRCAKKLYERGKLNDEYAFVLSYIHLIEIIAKEYPDGEVFLWKCEAFKKSLVSSSSIQDRVNKEHLISFLKSYTRFFNRMIEEKHRFIFDEEMMILWNQKCLMAYLYSWSGK